MNPNPINSSWQSEHLILLVGTNPLPNYVAAELLLKQDGQIYLIHSDATQKIAGHLETNLRQQGIKAIAKTKVNESDAADITKKMISLVEKIESGNIGLHYTGGTKVMAVHAHKAFLQALKDYHPEQKPVCSYLDARDYEMKFDPQPGHNGFGEKVLQSVKVDLETILKLHDIKLTKKSLDTTPVLLKSAEFLANLHSDASVAAEWREWCENELRKKTRDNKKNRWLEKQFQLEPITLNLPASEVFQELNAQLCAELGLPANGKISLKDVKPGKPFRKTYHLLAWLDGIWLENYVFDEILAIADEVGLTDKAMSLDTLPVRNKPDFEFDVGAMKGYQLFGLSCSTTQNKTLPKSKLFEAYIRARQLGGDEARMALVCPQEGLKRKLEKELPESFQGKVRVFDSAVLVNLRDALKIWFETAQ